MTIVCLTCNKGILVPKKYRSCHHYKTLWKDNFSVPEVKNL